MLDVVTPHFRKARSQGAIIMNPLDSVQSERHADSVDLGGLTFEMKDMPAGIPWTRWSVTNVCSPGAIGGFGEDMLADLFGTPSWGAAITPYNLAPALAMGSTLLSQALAKAGDSDTLFLVTMAELPKSLDFFYNGLAAAGRLVGNLERLPVNVLRQLASMRYRDIIRAAKGLPTRATLSRGGQTLLAGTRSAAQMWLGYRYGLMATYYDIMSWKDSLNQKKTRQRIVASSSTFYTSGDIVSTSTSNDFFNATRTTRYSRSTLSSAGCLCSLGMDGLADTKGALRILSTAWELLPLSFVLDWFLDTSTRIQALEGSVLRPTLGTWIVHRHTLSKYDNYLQTGKVKTGSNPLCTGFGSRGGTTTEDTRYTQRIANPTVSYLPELRVNLNWKRVTDGVALARVLGPRLKDVFSKL